MVEKVFRGCPKQLQPGFVVLGQRLGTKTLHDYLLNFGFGSKTGIDLNVNHLGYYLN